MELRVSFRGKALVVQGMSGATSIADLKAKLADLSAVPTDNQKLILKGKALRGDSDTLQEVGVVAAVTPVAAAAAAATAAAAAREGQDAGGDDQEDQDQDPDQDQDQQHFVQNSRLMMVGSLPSEVEGVLKGRAATVTVRNDLNGGGAAPKGYKRVALNYPAGPPEFSRYRFERIETLPGLPEEETARKILESLAADPGVRAVLEKHQWTVGALCELYPEGKVGVSAKCVMGLNQNHGQKILLRLRTDDLKGFRKVLSIKKVLFHELAHNDISEHDDRFYRLMRQVEREAAELDWRLQSGRTVAGRPPGPRAEPAGLPGNGGGYILVKEAFEGGSGRLGGDSDALTNMFSAQELAGLAAVQRLTPEEQEVEDCCGHTEGNEAASAAAAGADSYAAAAPTATTAADSAAAAGFPRATASDDGGSEEGTAGDGLEEMEEEQEQENAREQEHEQREELEEKEHEQQGQGQGQEREQEQEPKPEGRRGRGGGKGGGGEGGVVEGEGVAGASVYAVDLAAAPPVSTVSDMEVDGVDPSEGRAPPSRPPPSKQTPTSTQTPPIPQTPPTPSTQAPTSTPTPTPTPTLQPPPPPTPTPARATTPTPAPSTPQPLSSDATAGLDALVAMGFPRESAAQALVETRGSITDAAYRLLTQEPSTADPVMAAAPVDGPTHDQFFGGGGGDGGVDGVVRLSRDVRVQEAADRIALYGDRTRAAQCLEVLAGVLRNIMENPEEAKFRRVRRSNGKFKASVGSVPGGVELLLAAGFEESGADQLQLSRRDPGLIWLARGTVEAWQERLAREISL